MKISLIAAVTSDGGLGQGGQLLYRISADMKHFRALTLGKPVIMGRKTYESFPNGPLPQRRNIIVTRQPDYQVPVGADIAATPELALEMASDADEVMIIGGGEIYARFMPVATDLYLTLIEAESPAGVDTRFPEVDPALWTEAEKSEPAVDSRSGVTYRFVHLVRRG